MTWAETTFLEIERKQQNFKSGLLLAALPSSMVKTKDYSRFPSL
jgi:hypothetical protein